ncbi:hypothetical protein BURK1_02544 [Burkholderiales bacterium]|nr:hypothetical protein BURK1_02544 [Burkholderiales bacterium]
MTRAGMPTAADTILRDQFRAALFLSIPPATVGVIAVLLGEAGDAGPLGIAGPVVALVLAWAGFMAIALVPAIALGRLADERFLLRTRVACPSCSASLPIIAWRCTQCRRPVGMPESSRPTYAIAMAAWGAFLLVLHLRPDRWLAS